MDDPAGLPRSLQLMSRHNSALLVIDVQQRLIPHVARHQQIVWNIGRLIEGATVLKIPVAATEQYPQGLGPTVSEIAPRLGSVHSKLTFSCAGCPQLVGQLEELAGRGIHKILVTGVEAHVCVQQTALDLMADGLDVYVAADAVGSRQELDCEMALRRLDSAGATLTTTEAALFEWCQEAGTPEFRQISALARRPPP
jgi:nicotinamidase-related amidase